MKKKAMLYPFSMDTVSIPRYRNLLCEYELVSVVAPAGLAMEGIDCCVIDEGPFSGMIVSNSFENALESCDAVIAAEYEFLDNRRFFDKVIERLKTAMTKEKDIFCTMFLEAQILEDLTCFANMNHVNFVYAADQVNGTEAILKQNMYIQTIETPIVVVTGLCDNCLKFELQLAIRDSFLRKDIRVSQIGSRHYSELFGFHSFPGFMFENQYTEEEKILAFNQYIRDLERNENPEVIVIGIPGGIMQYSGRVLNGFGVKAYEVGCAISSDYTILAIPCEGIDNEYVDILSQILKYRNNMILDCICIANTHYNDESIKNLNLLPQIEIMSDHYVDLMRSNYNGSLPLFKSYDSLQRTLMVEGIYNQLVQNVGKVEGTII